VGEVLQGQEVLEVVGVAFGHHRCLRLELAQPVERALEPVDPRERVHVAVGDDAEAVAAVAERDEPEPVAGAHQVDRALPAQPRRDPRLPRRVVGPVVNLDARIDPPPGRVGAVRAGLDQPEAALDQP
jgi:hypothetical protein